MSSYEHVPPAVFCQGCSINTTGGNLCPLPSTVDVAVFSSAPLRLQIK